MPGFSYLGEGQCRDSSGQGYDTFYRNGLASSHECASWCLTATPNAGLVGFKWDSSWYPFWSFHWCYCLYNDGERPNPPTDAAGYDDIYTGKGNIAQVDPAGSVYCYSNDRFVSTFLT